MASSFAMVLRGSSSVDDFDGDSRTDIAFAKPQGCVNGVYRYQIEVRFSIRPRATFEVQAGPIGGGLHIRSRDVDGDRELDVVITTGVSGAPLGVWINDGHGRLTLGVAGGYPSSNWQDANETLGGPYSPAASRLVGRLARRRLFGRTGRLARAAFR
jgi:hypothetical protein